MTEFYQKTLTDTVKILKTYAEHLIPYNYPKADVLLEDYISLLKTLLVEVDGYLIRVHYTKMDYDTHYVEVCQISAEIIPFLPFSTIVKVGKAFLGDNYLSLMKQIVGGKVYWCWTVCTDRNNVPIPWIYEINMQAMEYNGFEYNYVKPGSIDFH
jgi:hypothetical protein